MKISHKHLLNKIKSKPSITELSDVLFQLGHEHEINEDIFDIEFTPNRGDCLSVNGLLRDLMPFYEINLDRKIYEQPIEPYDLDFNNEAKEDCSNISFLKIDLAKPFIVSEYKNELMNYFQDLNISKNNFFTDISNYISYETGQPTHCYDLSKIHSQITLKEINGNYNFETLLGKSIKLTDKNLVFICDDEIINLAGVMGGKNSACDLNTSSVLIECAHFNSEKIIGKCVKYDLISDAAHKFERTVDPNCHENVLRRFIYMVGEHVDIKEIKKFSSNYKEIKTVSLKDNLDKINNILGTSINYNDYSRLLKNLGFIFVNDEIHVPSYRSDIKTHNDLAEEVSRVIGYNNIPSKKIIIQNNNAIPDNNLEYNVKNFLIKNGFFEVISNPFSSLQSSNAIEIDNPLDTNKRFIRTDLKESLLNTLLYNERRQQDSIKLFEISNLYTNADKTSTKKFVGIIASGREGKNYKQFSRKIQNSYLKNLLEKRLSNPNIKIEEIMRKGLNSKSNNPIYYIEIELDNFIEDKNDEFLSKNIDFDNQYQKVSDYPSSIRDLSFSVTDHVELKKLEEYLLNYKNNLLKEVYVFDFFVNKKLEETKIGFRFVFQSNDKTITDAEVNIVMDDIIENTLINESVTIPGL